MEDKRYLSAMAEYQRHMVAAFTARAKAEDIADRPMNAEAYRVRAANYAEQATEYEAAAAS